VFVTLLASFNYPGLEIFKEDGTWMSVAPRPGSLAVNIGDLLSRLTKVGLRLHTTEFKILEETDTQCHFSLSQGLMLNLNFQMEALIRMDHG